MPSKTHTMSSPQLKFILQQHAGWVPVGREMRSLSAKVGSLYFIYLFFRSCLDLLTSSMFGEESGSAIKLRKVNPQRPCTMLLSGAVGQREKPSPHYTPLVFKRFSAEPLISVFCIIRNFSLRYFPYLLVHIIVKTFNTFSYIATLEIAEILGP